MMSFLDKLAIVAVYAPLAGFLLCMLLLKFQKTARNFALLGIGCAFVATLAMIFMGQPQGPSSRNIVFFNWLSLDSLKINYGMTLNPLVMTMIFVVNSVSFLVHIYSLGYMAHDAGKVRFLGYLSLFTFMMLALVTSPNMLQLFFGWEGVGLASYLLIGFWSEKVSAANASMKAFIVNRVGDAGLIIAMGIMVYLFQSLDFEVIKTILDPKAIKVVAPEFKEAQSFFVPILCGCLVVGAMGKSAQFGLHVWLPDAMEGPTPVSALIHAATMVTAGVFLIAKLHFLFELAPGIKNFLVYLGLFTALFAGTVAIAQNDIKRIIAYSTCSQLGYMVAACGVGAYKSAIFHLLTHAFFKALLFLSAGSVIHAMSDEQDITKMGGLRSLIPYTYAYMWIGTLAIIGIPFFAGYYSKEAILHALYQNYHPLSYLVGLLVVILTSFYSLRLMLLVFHGTPRANEHVMAHVHESPKIMTAPLFVLSLGAIFSGYIGNYFFAVTSTFNWGSSLIEVLAKNTMHQSAVLSGSNMSMSSHTAAVFHHPPEWLHAAAIGCVLGGALLAVWIYGSANNRDRNFKTTAFYRFLQDKWRIDELYEFLICKPYLAISRFTWQICDLKVIDAFGPNGFAQASLRLSHMHQKLQTGLIYHYALFMVMGLLMLSILLGIVLIKPFALS